MKYNVYSDIKANTITDDGRQFPKSVCELINAYASTVIQFPIPVILIEQTKQGTWDIPESMFATKGVVGQCYSIIFDVSQDPQLFKAEIELTNTDFEQEFKSENWCFEMSLYGLINEMTKEVKQFSHMDSHIYLKRRKDGKCES